ncbi:hypothetical protein LY474_04400 [Myxococcus stipitatus]|uniref:hypothetical protein n=1 Tax=Myxococcus stipitatus TaxID=83455 RepID=UPI001F205E91|nr:hypothetical protein [Myxococcus stipitatus]MCE9667048.1 hypothetical protein [Myxococcus stipitatus]
MSKFPTQRKRNSAIPIIVITAAMVVGGGLAAGVLLVGKGTTLFGGSKWTDVGGLQELAAAQAQWLPLAACEVQYGVRAGVLAHRSTGSWKTAYVTPCGESPVSYVSVDVPPELQSREVAFNLERSSPTAPWKVMVQKDSVAFPELKRSLEQLAPLIVEQYPLELARAIESNAASERQWQESQAAERARKEAAKNSYPE